MTYIKDKTILVTGGTGSFGKKFVEVILRDYPQVKKIIIFSRGELKQYDMQQKYPRTNILNYVSSLVMFAITNA